MLMPSAPLAALAMTRVAAVQVEGRRAMRRRKVIQMFAASGESKGTL